MKSHVGSHRVHLVSKNLKSKLKHGPLRLHKSKQREYKQDDKIKKPKKPMWLETRAGALKGAKFVSNCDFLVTYNEVISKKLIFLLLLFLFILFFF